MINSNLVSELLVNPKMYKLSVMPKAWMLSIVGVGVLQATLRADIVLPANTLAAPLTDATATDATTAFSSPDTSLSVTVGLDALLADNSLTTLGNGASAATLSAGLFGGAWAGGSALVADPATQSATVFKYWISYPVLSKPAATPIDGLPLAIAPVTSLKPGPASYAGFHLTPIFTNALNVGAAITATPAPTLTEAVTTPSSDEAMAIGAFDAKTHIQIGTISNFFIALSPTLSPVPEPQSLALLGLGITALVAHRRLRPAA